MNSYDEELMLQEEEQILNRCGKKEFLTPSNRVIIKPSIINKTANDVKSYLPEVSEDSDYKNAPKVETAPVKISNVTEQTEFSRVVDQAKINIVNEAAASDEKFVSQVKNELKEATIKLAETEKDKAELEQQNIAYHSELLETKQELNKHIQAENKWTNREKRRQYHFNGVSPIMAFVGIKTPMNLVILYFLTVMLLPFFLFSKFLKGTIGVLISGAEDGNRPKQVRGFMWTLLGIIFLAVTFLVIYLMLKWLGLVG